MHLKKENNAGLRRTELFCYHINIMSMWFYSPSLPFSVFPLITPSQPPSFLEPVEPVQVRREGGREGNKGRENSKEKANEMRREERSRRGKIDKKRLRCSELWEGWK